MVGDKVYGNVNVDGNNNVNKDDKKELNDVQDDVEIARATLKEWNLSKYEEKLIDEEGYDNVNDWMELTEGELINDIGMKKGHCKRFLKKRFTINRNCKKDIEGMGFSNL